MSCADWMFYIRCGVSRQYCTMKVILCLVLAVGGLNAHIVPLSDAQKEKANEYTVECGKQTGVKPEIIAAVNKGQFDESEDLKKFALCFFQKSGIVGPDGTLNVETALSKIPPGIDKAEATKVLEDCKNKKGATAEDTAFQTLKCYRNGITTHIAL